MAQLLAVNVGLPREIEWKGKTVRTAVWKDAVLGRRKVGRLNVDGDGQADLRGHGVTSFSAISPVCLHPTCRNLDRQTPVHTVPGRSGTM